MASAVSRVRTYGLAGTANAVAGEVLRRRLRLAPAELGQPAVPGCAGQARVGLGLGVQHQIGRMVERGDYQPPSRCTLVGDVKERLRKERPSTMTSQSLAGALPRRRWGRASCPSL